MKIINFTPCNLSANPHFQSLDLETNMTKKSQSTIADAAAATATANNLTMRIIWTDKMLENYLDVCISEVQAGNRPRTHFNKIGWRNVINKFSEKMGRQYSYKQLKNKWDNLKKDWNIWMKLIGNETGLGWDPVKKTIDATEAWWAKKLQEIPEAAKFQSVGLAHVAKMKILFNDITTTNEMAWAPSSRLPFDDIGSATDAGVSCDKDKNVLLEHLDDSDDESDLDANDSDDISADFDTQDKGKKWFSSRVQVRKRKNEVQIIDQHFSRICDALERSLMRSGDIDKPRCSIKEVMDVVFEIIKIEDNIDILTKASEVLLTRSHREMFVALKDPEFQLDFIKRMGNKKVKN
ncbi:hypothetical protein I3842_04G115600 [Carya illinoinensis]|uniref:Myb/SANT-like domain-containing protein n=1 Tax=Carya illinoinensis TaxID=32201 RepID=A0A922JRN9_CARIL|nr:hypothetical protein I3842_04G115600 [Carya illinoinensis]